MCIRDSGDYTRIEECNFWYPSCYKRMLGVIDTEPEMSLITSSSNCTVYKSAFRYTDGSVLDPYVVESSPAGVFDRAAIKAVRKFLYQPPTYNGTSVKVNNVQIDLTFKLAN